MNPFSKQRNLAVKMCCLFPSENDSCDLHRHDLQHRAAGHDIEPYLARVLRFGNRRGNGGNDNQQRTDTADDGGNADQWKQSRCAASVDGVLNGLVQSVPRRRKAAGHKTEGQQQCAPAPPILDIVPVIDRIPDKAQQGKEYQRRGRGHGISEIELHRSPFPFSI